MALTEEEKLKIDDLWKKGVSIKDMSKILNRAENTIRSYTNELEESPNNNTKPQKSKKKGLFAKISEESQLTYELNKLAQILDRTPEELLRDILEMCFAWYTCTENVLEIFDYSFYIATLVKKLKFNENTKERELIDFLLECKRDWEEIENVRSELEELEKSKDEVVDNIRQMKFYLEELNNKYSETRTVMEIQYNIKWAGERKKYEKEIKDIKENLNNEISYLKNIVNITDKLIPTHIKQKLISQPLEKSKE